MSGATENVDGSKKEWIHGKTVVDGELRFLSVSSVEKGDASSGTGCLRKWHFNYIEGLKEPKTKSSERGDKCHAETAHYLRTGDRSQLSSLVMSGLHMMPPAGNPRLRVEYDIVPTMPDGSSGLAHARLRAAGVPFTGAIDLFHDLPENYGVSDVLETRDPEGIWKFVDWKFPGSIERAKANHELVETHQMAGYALWGFLTAEACGIPMERVRISHGYMPVRGTPRMSTALVTRDQVERTWKRTTSVAVAIKDAARETDPNKVEANTRACRAYNRDCPAKVAGRCTAVAQSTLTALVGRTAAERLLRAAHDPGDQRPMNTPIAPGSLFAQLPGQPSPLPAAALPTAAPFGQLVMPAPAPAPQAAVPPPAAPTPAPAPAPQPSPVDVQAEMARLAAQEAALAAPKPPTTVLDYLQAIESYGLGVPAFSSAAAPHVAAAKGYQLSFGAGLAGTGILGKHEITDINQLPAALESVKAMAANRAAAQTAAPAAPAPMPAPTPAPAQASIPSVLPPDAPLAPLPVQVAPPAPAGATPSPEDGEGKKKRGRKPKVQADAPTPQAVAPASLAPATPTAAPAAPAPTMYAQQPAQVAPTPAPPAVAASAPQTAINFYVDVAIDGVETKPFRPEVDKLLAAMTADSGERDFRLVGRDSKYAFGSWRAILAASLEDSFAQGLIAPANYMYDGATGEIGSAVCEAMRGIVLRSGGVFVKGAR